MATTRAEVAPLLQRWYVLIVMCAVYAINIGARYVVTTVFEPIRLELKLTDAGAAFVTGVPLALFYVGCGLPIAWLADRSNRRNIVATSLILWSGFTVSCGLALSSLQFVLARIGVGVGEAGATPPSVKPRSQSRLRSCGVSGPRSTSSWEAASVPCGDGVWSGSRRPSCCEPTG